MDFLELLDRNVVVSEEVEQDDTERVDVCLEAVLLFLAAIADLFRGGEPHRSYTGCHFPSKRTLIVNLVRLSFYRSDGEQL